MDAGDDLRTEGVEQCSLTMRASKLSTSAKAFFVEATAIQVGDSGNVVLVAADSVSGLNSRQPGAIVLAGLFGKMADEHETAHLPGQRQASDAPSS